MLKVHTRARVELRYTMTSNGFIANHIIIHVHVYNLYDTAALFRSGDSAIIVTCVIILNTMMIPQASITIITTTA